MIHDVAIIGGGPAGLSAALVLGRCCRQVLLCDSGRPRNGSSPVHGFLTRDGTAPGELRRLARAELRRYPSVEVRTVEVRDVERGAATFELILADGRRAVARKLLLATGVVDDLPPIPGLAALWGRSVFPCPYCDAYELRGGPLGVLGRGEPALTLCRSLTSWSTDLLLFSNGPLGLSDEDANALRALGVRLVAEGVVALDASDGRLARVRVAGRAPIACEGLFVAKGQHQRSPLVQKLGCTVGPSGAVDAESYGATGVPGVYVAGDASEGVQFAIVAAAEGARAAFAINRAFVRERFAAATRSAALGIAAEDALSSPGEGPHR